MSGNQKLRTLLGTISILIVFSWGSALAQLEVIEETGPYSYNVVGPNNHGDVAGHGPDGGVDGAYGWFIWYGDGSILPIAPLAPTYINDNGIEAGVIHVSSPYASHAAIRINGEVIDLHLLLNLPVESGSGSFVVGLTSTGTVAIRAWSYSRGGEGYLWSQSAGVTEIALPDNAHGPEAMNELGEVIGQCSYPDPDRWCVYYWSPVTGYEEIVSSSYYVYPVAINDRSEVVGYLYEKDPIDGSISTPRQYYWRPGETLQIFATGLGQVIDINNSGTVLGWESARPLGGYLWTASDGFIKRNLMLPGSTNTKRLHINDLDFVAGTTYGVKRNFLWTPTYGYQVIDAYLPTDVEGMQGRFVVADGLTRYEIVLPPATPVEAIDDVVEDIVNLVEDGAIDDGEQASLGSKLDAATTLFSDERTTPACNMINATVNQLNAKMKAGSIDPIAGSELIEKLTAIEECSGT